MKSMLVASSRSRTTEVYRGENGQLFQVYYFKSGAVEVTPVPGIPGGLTVEYDPPQDTGWEFDPEMPAGGIRFPSLFHGSMPMPPIVSPVTFVGRGSIQVDK